PSPSSDPRRAISEICTISEESVRSIRNCAELRRTATRPDPHPHQEHRMTALDAATALFAELAGHEPDGLWSAPGRVNLIGEHTDYNEGFVLPFAIPHRTVAAVGRRADERIRVASTFTEDTVEVEIGALNDLFPTAAGSEPAVPEWSAYVLGVAWALRMLRPEASVTGVDIAIASDVPVGAGLSSSAAIEGAVATALNELWDLQLDPVALAQVGRRAENEAVGAPTGIMDQ